MMRRIAVVEDNPGNRLLVQVMLEDYYELDMYESGTDALAGMTSVTPDLVLLDISLPGMDGPEVLAWMRANPWLAKVPTVAITAHAMSGDREKYLGMGFDGYISKPIIDEEQLLRVVDRLLARPAA